MEFPSDLLQRPSSSFVLKKKENDSSCFLFLWQQSIWFWSHTCGLEWTEVFFWQAALSFSALRLHWENTTPPASSMWHILNAFGTGQFFTNSLRKKWVRVSYSSCHWWSRCVKPTCYQISESIISENTKAKQTAPLTQIPPHNCTFVHFSDRHLLLNIVLLSSVVRAMQGLKVMPGSMERDKDLGKVEQDTNQTNSQ